MCKSSNLLSLDSLKNKMSKFYMCKLSHIQLPDSLKNKVNNFIAFKSSSPQSLDSLKTKYVKSLKLFVAFPWVETSTGPGGFMICVFII